MRDTSGFKVKTAAVLQNFTNDGRLADTKWNQRHQVGPSQWNDTNHNFHRQFFDKPPKHTEDKKIRELS